MAVTRNKPAPRVRALDDSAAYMAGDPSGMRHRLAGMGEQCREAFRHVRGLAAVFPAKGPYRAVVVAGMGGSAVGGDLLVGFSESRDATVPIFTWRDYGLPSWVGQDTLVIVSSNSGETEEALSAFQSARARGCDTVALTKGGALSRMAAAENVPVMHVPYRGEPRNALGYSVMGPLALLESAGILSGVAEDVDEAATLLASLAGLYGTERPTEENPAKTLALRARGRLPLFYAAGHLSAVARRWKTDFNENAKCWAFAETLPELDHNTVNGYDLPSFLPAASLVIFLRSGLLPLRTLRRYEVTAELLEQSGVEYAVVDAEGDGVLGQIMATAYLGSWTSYYLGLLHVVDPSPVPGNEYLKERMNAAAQPLAPA